MKLHINKNFLVFNTFFLMIFLISSMIILLSIGNYSHWAKILSVIIIFEIVIQQTQIYFMHIQVYDFRSLFIIIHYIFIFGRILIYGFFPNYEIAWDLPAKFSDEMMLKAGLFCVCSIQSIFIGLFLPKINEIQCLVKKDNKKFDKSMFYAGVACLIIGGPAAIYTNYKKIMYTQLTGFYSSLVLNIGVIDDLEILFIVAIILIICSNYIKIITSRIILLVSISFYIIVMIMSGDRRYQFSAIITFICLWIEKLQFNKKIKFFHKILIVFIAFMMLNLLSFIRQNREGGLSKLPLSIINNPKILFSGDVIFQTLAEFGVSFFSICNLFLYIPDYYAFQLGKSFIIALAIFLPLGYMKDPSFIDWSEMSNVINKQRRMHVGATFIGGFYSNFGWFSIIILIFISYYMSKIINKRKMISNKNFWYDSRYFILLYIWINLPRASFTQVLTRPVIFGILIPYFIYYSIKKLKI